MKKVIVLIVAILSLFSCSGGSDFKLFMMELSDAENLKIVKEYSKSKALTSKNILKKTLAGGQEEDVEYYNQLKFKISLDNGLEPFKLVPVNDEYFIIAYGWDDSDYEGYSIGDVFLVNINSGRVYSLNDGTNYSLPVTEVECVDDNLYFSVGGSNMDISFTSSVYSPSNSITGFYKIDISNPDNITAINLVPDSYTLSSLNNCIDSSGNVYLELNNTPKVITKELLYLPVDTNYGYFFERNGSICVLKAENLHGDSADFNVKTITVESQETVLGSTVYGFNHTQHELSLGNNAFNDIVYRKQNDSLYMISADSEKDIYKYSFTDDTFTTLTSESFRYYIFEGDLIYLIDENYLDLSYVKICKFDLATENIEEVYTTQGEYPEINLKVNSSGYFYFTSVNELTMREVIVLISPDGTSEEIDGESLVTVVDLLEL